MILLHEFLIFYIDSFSNCCNLKTVFIFEEKPKESQIETNTRYILYGQNFEISDIVRTLRGIAQQARAFQRSLQRPAHALYADQVFKAQARAFFQRCPKDYAHFQAKLLLETAYLCKRRPQLICSKKDIIRQYMAHFFGVKWTK